jgi:hypothetical protein
LTRKLHFPAQSNFLLQPEKSLCQNPCMFGQAHSGGLQAIPIVMKLTVGLGICSLLAQQETKDEG